MHPQNYKAYIDGLRAIAVLVVILFHFDPEMLPGGYLGVDIFFVISGYVVTSSVMNKSYESWGRFLKDFLSRRVKRLLPALMLCVLVTSGLCFAFIPNSTSMLDIMLRTGLASLLGLSNVFLFKESANYFASSTELNLFTHTWSLGVEEQFYLLFPLLFALAQQGRGSGIETKLKGILAVLSISSFIFYISYSHINFNASFYLMPARFWELGLGCLAFLYLGKKKDLGPPWLADIISMASLTIISFCLFYSFEKQYWNVILTALSSVTLLALLPHSSLIKSYLSLKPLVKIGLISYSLYLWHWPIIAVRKWMVASNWMVLVFQVMAIFIMAMLSYTFVEKKLRHARWSDSSGRTILMGVGTSILMIAFIRAGTPWFSQNVYQGDLSSHVEKKKCENESGPAVWLLGDSHAAAYEHTFSELFKGDCYRSKDETLSVFYSEFSGQDLGEKKPTRRVVLRELTDIEATIKRVKPKALVFAHYWQGFFSPTEMSYPSSDWLISDYKWQDKNLNYQEAFAASLESITQLAERNKGLDIHILLPLPDFDWVSRGGPPPGLCQKEWFRPQPGDLHECENFVKVRRHRIEEIEERRGHLVAGLKGLANRVENVKIYDPVPSLCVNGVCSTHDRNGRPLFKDDDHINISGGRLLLESLRVVFY